MANLRILWIVGGPGSGKSTQRDKIVEKFNFAHVASRDLLTSEEIAYFKSRETDPDAASGSGVVKEVQDIRKGLETIREISSDSDSDIEEEMDKLKTAHDIYGFNIEKELKQLKDFKTRMKNPGLPNLTSDCEEEIEDKVMRDNFRKIFRVKVPKKSVVTEAASGSNIRKVSEKLGVIDAASGSNITKESENLGVIDAASGSNIIKESKNLGETDVASGSNVRKDVEKPEVTDAASGSNVRKDLKKSEVTGAASGSDVKKESKKQKQKRLSDAASGSKVSTESEKLGVTDAASGSNIRKETENLGKTDVASGSNVRKDLKKSEVTGAASGSNVKKESKKQKQKGPSDATSGSKISKKSEKLGVSDAASGSNIREESKNIGETVVASGSNVRKDLKKPVVTAAASGSNVRKDLKKSEVTGAASGSNVKKESKKQKQKGPSDAASGSKISKESEKLGVTDAASGSKIRKESEKLGVTDAASGSNITKESEKLGVTDAASGSNITKETEKLGVTDAASGSNIRKESKNLGETDAASGSNVRKDLKRPGVTDDASGSDGKKESKKQKQRKLSISVRQNLKKQRLKRADIIEISDATSSSNLIDVARKLREANDAVISAVENDLESLIERLKKLGLKDVVDDSFGSLRQELNEVGIISTPSSGIKESDIIEISAADSSSDVKTLSKKLGVTDAASGSNVAMNKPSGIDAACGSNIRNDFKQRQGLKKSTVIDVGTGSDIRKELKKLALAKYEPGPEREQMLQKISPTNFNMPNDMFVSKFIGGIHNVNSSEKDRRGIVIDECPQENDCGAAFESFASFVDIILYLECSDETMLKRLMARAAVACEDKSNFNEKIIKKHFESLIAKFNSNVNVIFAQYSGKTITINGELGEDEVFAIIQYTLFPDETVSEVYNDLSKEN